MPVVAAVLVAVLALVLLSITAHLLFSPFVLVLAAAFLYLRYRSRSRRS